MLSALSFIFAFTCWNAFCSVASVTVIKLDHCYWQRRHL